MNNQGRILGWCLLVSLVVPGCSDVQRRISKPGPSRNMHVWKSYPQDEFRTWTAYSPDGKLQVTIVDEKDHRAWWYAVQIRLHHVDPNVSDIVFSWKDAPGSAWYPLFDHVFRVIDPDDDIYVLLGWTAEGIGRPTLHAWTVTVKDGSMAIRELSFSGDRRIRLVVTFGGGLGLFLPGVDPPDPDGGYRAWVDPDDPQDHYHVPFPCRVIVNGKKITDKQLRAGSSPAPSRIGFWYTRGRFMNEEPLNGRVFWVNEQTISANIRPDDSRDSTTDATE